MRTLARLGRPQQPNAERDDSDGKDESSRVNQGDGSASFSGSRRKHRKEEPRRNEDCSERYSDSNEPKNGGGKKRRVRQNLAEQRKNNDHARVGMSGAEEILAQRVLHVAAAFVHQRGQQKISAVLNCGHRNEDDPRHQSGFASHRVSFDTTPLAVVPLDELCGRSVAESSSRSQSSKTEVNGEKFEQGVWRVAFRLRRLPST